MVMWRVRIVFIIFFIGGAIIMSGARIVFYIFFVGGVMVMWGANIMAQLLNPKSPLPSFTHDEPKAAAAMKKEWRRRRGEERQWAVETLRRFLDYF